MGEGVRSYPRAGRREIRMSGCVSSQARGEIVEYPDSGKVGAGVADPTSPVGFRRIGMFRARSGTLDYWESGDLAPPLRNRWFADSPLEGDGFELLVLRHESRGFPEHPGHRGYLYHPRGRKTLSRRRVRRSGRRLRNQSLWFGVSSAASGRLRPSTHATSRQCHRDCGPVRQRAGIQSSPAA